MAILRSQYITVAELNEIIGVTTYTNADLVKIYEASEAIKNYCWQYPNIYVDDYTTVTAPKDLKLATAYQVQYMENNSDIDNDYAGNSKSIGIGATNESVSYGSGNNNEYRKISPKARRYLFDGGLIYRVL